MPSIVEQGQKYVFCPGGGKFLFHYQGVVQFRPAEKFCVVTPQTPLKFLGQNLIGDQFWSRSEAGKVCPQAILGTWVKGMTGGVIPGPKIAWGHTFPASDQPQNRSPIRFWPKNLSGV